MTLPTPLLLSLLACSLLLSLIALVMAVVSAKRQKRLLNQYRVLLANGSPQDIESLLFGQATTLEQLTTHLAQLDRQVAAHGEQARHHIQKVGMLRFNAFPDTGSDQSFSVALLDADGNGLVLTSLYGRTETRTYAKPIQAGKSAYPLSDEEIAALDQAQAK
ncbi:MAG TPA: DUF4446 family protein [Symbiobacteriaceae bacterium]|nr:DUF4446 family protein [Symbiobacteriaceae bacterium]